MKTPSPRLASLLALAPLLALGVELPACTQRDAVWEAGVDDRLPVAAQGTLALPDPGAERMLFATPGPGQELATQALPVGRSIPPNGVRATPDLKTILALCRGDVPRRSARDQSPALFAFSGGPAPSLTARYELSDPLSGLTLDPLSRFAIVSASADDESFVTNPNELIIADLSRPPAADNPVSVTLRSFGGRPAFVDFTPPLNLPSGSHRLLVVRTDRDVALLDLDDLSQPDITVRLTGGSSVLTPVGFAVTPGDAQTGEGARMAVRLASDPNVVIVDFLPPSANDPAPVPYRPTPNIVGVGGPASDIAFVHTDGGLRLAALVPGKNAMTLIEPATGALTVLDLGAPFEHIALVTDQAGGDASGDVAMVWSESTPSLGLISLGNTAGKPYKSVDIRPLDSPIAAVLDVPAPRQQLKVLSSAAGDSFFVLDLPSRQVSPLTSRAGRSLSFTLAPDGGRAWVIEPDTENLASVDLGALHPQNLLLSLPIARVFDVARADGGRSLIAYHRVPGSAGSLTVLDGHAPSLVGAREYPALFAQSLP